MANQTDDTTGSLHDMDWGLSDELREEVGDGSDPQPSSNDDALSGAVRALSESEQAGSEQIRDIEDKHGDVDPHNTTITDEGGLKTETTDSGTVIDNPGDPEGGVDVSTTDNPNSGGVVTTVLDGGSGLLDGVDTRTLALGLGALGAVLVGLSMLGGGGSPRPSPRAAPAGGGA